MVDFNEKAIKNKIKRLASLVLWLLFFVCLFTFGGRFIHNNSFWIVLLFYIVSVFIFYRGIRVLGSQSYGNEIKWQGFYKLMGVFITLFTIVVLLGQLGIFQEQLLAFQNQNTIYEKQLEITEDMFNYQYKPQILIEVISPRKNSHFTTNGYEEPNTIYLYNDDFAKAESITSPGKIEQLSSASFPLKINFYNFGSVGTKINKIESFNSCNKWKIHSWQMDVMDATDKRIIYPKEKMEYNLFYAHINFDKKPVEFTSCKWNITYTFFNDFQINESYNIYYYHHNNPSKEIELTNQLQFIETSKKERLKNKN